MKTCEECGEKAERGRHGFNLCKKHYWKYAKKSQAAIAFALLQRRMPEWNLKPTIKC